MNNLNIIILASIFTCACFSCKLNKVTDVLAEEVLYQSPTEFSECALRFDSFVMKVIVPRRPEQPNLDLGSFIWSKANELKKLNTYSYRFAIYHDSEGKAIRIGILKKDKIGGNRYVCSAKSSLLEQSEKRLLFIMEENKNELSCEPTKCNGQNVASISYHRIFLSPTAD